MHPLLKFTLDLFESNRPLAPVLPAYTAITSIAKTPQAPTFQPPDPVSASAFRHPRANREALLCHTVVAFEFKRSKRRTIGFMVGPQGLVVRAPNWVALREVDAALQGKSDWIIQKLGESVERVARLGAQRLVWCDGATVAFLGEPMALALNPLLTNPPRGVAAGVLHVDAETGTRTLRLALPVSATPDHIRDAVQAWLIRQARQLFTERLDHFAPLLQVRWRSLALSNAKTRWGSARADGSIRLNWRLLHFSQAIVDYVVAHELSHLREMNHSPRFWDTVRLVLPDYATRRMQLKAAVTPSWD